MCGCFGLELGLVNPATGSGSVSRFRFSFSSPRVPISRFTIQTSFTSKSEFSSQVAIDMAHCRLTHNCCNFPLALNAACTRAKVIRCGMRANAIKNLARRLRSSRPGMEFNNAKWRGMFFGEEERVRHGPELSSRLIKNCAERELLLVDVMKNGIE